MNHEGQPEVNESQESEENIEQLFEQEIHKALSSTWAKSTQELLPGYLPNKSPGEYSQDELDRYRIAYRILGEMTQRGELEVLFEEESLTSDSGSPVENETIAIPRFKLVTKGGKKSESHNVSWSGDLAPAAPMLRRDFLKSVGAGLALGAFGLQVEAESHGEKEGSPFDPEVQKAALSFVAETMHVTIDVNVAPLPVIVDVETVSNENFNKIIGYDTGGTRQNLFLPPNTIFLMKDSEMHNLVHECVHYIQSNYKGFTDGTTDEVENQAVAIQNLFRERGSGKSN